MGELWPQNIYTKALWPKTYIQRHSIPKHPDSLAYKTYVHLQLGFILGISHSRPPYLCIVLSALYTHVQKKKFKKIQKDVSTFPTWHPRVPTLHLRDRNRSTGPLSSLFLDSKVARLPCLVCLSVELKSFLLTPHESYSNQLYDNIRHILFKQRHMKTLCMHMDTCSASMYAIGPILSRISNGPQYLVAIFGKLPNLRELFLSFTFTNTYSPTLNYLCILLFST
jgi:hypothetical protein